MDSALLLRQSIAKDVFDYQTPIHEKASEGIDVAYR